MSCPDKMALRSYVTPEEYKIIKENAGLARMSVSSYLKTICLGHEIKSAEDKGTILEMAKVSADLGRLGGLFKLALVEKAIDQLRGNSILDDMISSEPANYWRRKSKNYDRQPQRPQSGK